MDYQYYYFVLNVLQRNYKEMCKIFEKKFPKKIKRMQEMTQRNRYWPTTGIFALDFRGTPHIGILERD